MARRCQLGPDTAALALVAPPRVAGCGGATAFKSSYRTAAQAVVSTAPTAALLPHSWTSMQPQPDGDALSSHLEAAQRAAPQWAQCSRPPSLRRTCGDTDDLLAVEMHEAALHLREARHHAHKAVEAGRQQLRVYEERRKRL